MKFAYADPPYLGQGRHYEAYHPEAKLWNDPDQHRKLISRLIIDYPDGWALSASSPSLKTILPMCPSKVRICAWVKPFAVAKPFVEITYAWEPVIIFGGRKREHGSGFIRDWLSENACMSSDIIGQKPRRFCRWVFELLGALPGDTLDDIFPGSGVVTCAWQEWVGEFKTEQLPLFSY
jgi:hypothetical protein